MCGKVAQLWGKSEDLWLSLKDKSFSGPNFFKWKKKNS